MPADETYRFLQIPFQTETGKHHAPANVAHMNTWLKGALRPGEHVIAMTADRDAVLLLVALASAKA